ncbi:unnamed protein product, partial [Meganyctiphanes norvegica]
MLLLFNTSHEFTSSSGYADGSICASTRNCDITIKSSVPTLLITIKNITNGDQYCNDRIEIKKSRTDMRHVYNNRNGRSEYTTVTSWQQMKKLCLRDNLPVILSPGSVRLSFYSSTFQNGMNVSWIPFDPFEMLPLDNSGVLLSPGYPEYFINAASDKWSHTLNLDPPSGSYVNLKLTDFNSNHENNNIEM